MGVVCAGVEYFVESVSGDESSGARTLGSEVTASGVVGVCDLSGVGGSTCGLLIAGGGSCGSFFRFRWHVWLGDFWRKGNL